MYDVFFICSEMAFENQAKIWNHGLEASCRECSKSGLASGLSENRCEDSDNKAKNITRQREEAMRINGQYIMSIAMKNAIPLQHSTDTAQKAARTTCTHKPPRARASGGRKSGTGAVSNSLGVLRQKTAISLFFQPFLRDPLGRGENVQKTISFLTPPKT